MTITGNPQHRDGKAVEAWLDHYFARRGWLITPTSRHEERDLHLGDRYFSKGGLNYLVEYKSGLQTFYTDNLFLETVSVDTRNVPGWVYTCNANFIFYAALLNRKILIFHPEKLRSVIERLKTQFPEGKTGKQQNEDYNAIGVLVPLSYAEQHLADKIIRVEESF